MQNIWLKLLVILVVCSASVNSWAADDPTFNCLEPTTQMEMNHCGYQEFLAADVLLNAYYKLAKTAMIELDTHLPKNLVGAQKALLYAQRAWIKYRDLACESEGYVFKGGTIEPLMVSTCKADLTRQRSARLRELSHVN